MAIGHDRGRQFVSQLGALAVGESLRTNSLSGKALILNYIARDFAHGASARSDHYRSLSRSHAYCTIKPPAVHSVGPHLSN